MCVCVLLSLVASRSLVSRSLHSLGNKNFRSVLCFFSAQIRATIGQAMAHKTNLPRPSKDALSADDVCWIWQFSFKLQLVTQPPKDLIQMQNMVAANTKVLHLSLSLFWCFSRLADGRDARDPREFLCIVGRKSGLLDLMVVVVVVVCRLRVELCVPCLRCWPNNKNSCLLSC